MTMKPYIFLSENGLSLAQDGSGNAIDIRSLENVQPPYEMTVFFTDRYGNIVNRSIDTLALTNTNIVNMTVSAADGLGNYSQIFEVSGNSEGNLFIKNETTVETSSLRFNIPDDTFNPSAINAKIGVYSFICNLWGTTDSNYKIEANQGGYRVVSGSYIHWADYKKWVSKVKIENLPKEQFDLLTEQADKGEMTVVPYQELEAEEIYEGAVNREYSWGLDRKTGLFELTLEFNEL